MAKEQRGGEHWGAESCEKEDKRVAGAAVLFSFLGSLPVQQKKLFLVRKDHTAQPRSGGTILQALVLR
jgi:hypothetical protein